MNEKEKIELLKINIWKDFNFFNEKHKHLPKKDFFIANAEFLVNRCAIAENKLIEERKAKKELVEALEELIDIGHIEDDFSKEDVKQLINKHKEK
jgi:hypothetical protein